MRTSSSSVARKTKLTVKGSAAGVAWSGTLKAKVTIPSNWSGAGFAASVRSFGLVALRTTKP